MSETTMLNFIGVFGLAILVLGVWLIRIDKKVAKKLTSNPTLTEEVMIQHRFSSGAFTKPLGYICAATGIVLVVIFSLTVSGLY